MLISCRGFSEIALDEKRSLRLFQDGEIPCVFFYSENVVEESYLKLLEIVSTLLSKRGLKLFPVSQNVEIEKVYGKSLNQLIQESVITFFFPSGQAPELFYHYGLLKGSGKPAVIFQESMPEDNAQSFWEKNGIEVLRISSKVSLDSASHPVNRIHEEFHKRSAEILEHYLNLRLKNKLTLQEEDRHRLFSILKTLMDYSLGVKDYCALDINCLKTQLRAFCQHLGAELPTELYAWFSSLYRRLLQGGRQDSFFEGMDTLNRALEVLGWALMFESSKKEKANLLKRMGDLFMETAKYPEFRPSVRFARDCYEKAFSEFSGEMPLFEKAALSNNLGTCSLVLSELEKSQPVMNQAMDYFQTALQVYSFADFPMEHALVLHNLKAMSPIGEAPEDLPEFSQPVEISEISYAESSEHTSEDISKKSMPYQPSSDVQATEDLSQKISEPGSDFWIETQKTFMLEPISEAMLNNKNEQAVEAEVKATVEGNLQTVDVKEAPASDKVEVDSMEKADQFEQAAPQKTEREQKIEDLKKSVQIYEAALQFFSPEVMPFEFARYQNQLGQAYCKLAEEGENRWENCHQALCAFEKALSIYEPKNFPQEFGLIHNDLGIVHSMLAEIDGAPELYEKATHCFEQALRIFRRDQYPDVHQSVQSNLEQLRDLWKEKYA